MTDSATMRGAWSLILDPLTGLPSAGIFFDRVQQALLIGRREKLRIVLMLLSLDVVEGAGDVGLDVEQRKLLLCGVADRLTGALRASDSAGRLDQGHFGVLLPHAHDEGVPLVAGRIMAQMMRPFELDIAKVYVRTSIGVAIAGDLHAFPVEADQLFDQASQAAELARSKGGGFEAFGSSIEARNLMRAMGGAS